MPAEPVAGSFSFVGNVPLCRTEITVEAQQAAVRVLASGWVTTGSQAAEFEREFAGWVGAPHAVAVSSCTAAIRLALRGLNLPPGAPVLTPTLTFCSAVQAIIDARLRPVLVDTDPHMLTLSAEAVAGEGGAITTTDPDLAARWRRLRLHGMNRDAWQRHGAASSWQYTVEEPGLKANFTDVQAAIGRAQLRHLHHWQQRRAAIAKRYDMLLADVPGIGLPPRPPDGGHAWHLYIIRIQPPFGMHRDTVADRLTQAGIGTTVHFTPVHHLPYYRDYAGPDNCAELTTADRVFPELLSLPMYPGLTEADVTRVAQTLASLSTSARSPRGYRIHPGIPTESANGYTAQ